MWWIVATFGILHHVSLRQRHHGCACVSVDECISNGVDVAPFCGCMDISGEDYVICYTTGACPGAFPSTVFAGATFRSCDYLPPPPPHPNACNDPLFTSQWHLDRIHAPDAWSYAAGGTLSSIAIVDDGLQYTHGDLRVDVERSFGWNSSTGMRLTTAHANDALHGTATAGVATAIRDNLRGGCGVAWGAALIGVRLLTHGASPADNVFMSESFASSLSELATLGNVVVSNSWGPPDDGRVDGPVHREFYSEVDAAMHSFYTTARNGLGGILVFANGNGGLFDNSNDDGFASHPTTISVGAVGDDHRRTPYTEPGACVDVVAPSDGGIRGIVTADLIGESGYASGNFTSSFGGTSASAPVVAGVIALMLDARPDLRAVDVRHILVETARRVHVDESNWVRNSAGRWFSPWYGFGMVDAQSAVSTALVWRIPAEPQEEICSDNWFGYLGLSDWEWRRIPIPSLSGTMKFVDRVSVFVDVVHPWRGDVVMRLISPSGTMSQLTFEVPNAVPLRDAYFVPHTYHTNAFYMEASASDGWVMDFRDVSARGRVRRLQLCVVGTRNFASDSPSPPPPPPLALSPPPLPVDVTDPTPTRIAAWSSVGSTLFLACCLFLFAVFVDDEEEEENEEDRQTRLRRRLRSRVSSSWEDLKRRLGIGTKTLPDAGSRELVLP